MKTGANVKINLGNAPVSPDNKIIIDGEEIREVTSIDLHADMYGCPYLIIKKWATGKIEVNLKNAQVDIIEEPRT